MCTLLRVLCASSSLHYVVIVYFVNFYVLNLFNVTNEKNKVLFFYFQSFMHIVIKSLRYLIGV